jgi:hypothetical protein
MTDGRESGIVALSGDEYDALIEDRGFLAALRAAGVDNWEGYSNAYNYLPGANEDDY